MIKIKGLEKNYGDFTVLKGIDFELNDAEIFGLVGRSGVGKSTLLNCLSGMEKYDKGSIAIDGINLDSLSNGELRLLRRNIGMIFQNFSLIHRKNVFKNIAFPMECWNYSKKEIKDRVEELASITGIESKLYERPDNLSGGQKQRVAIARALSLNPKYLFCDECTSALDPKSTIDILNLIKELRDRYKISVFMVTHEMSVIKNACDKMGILDSGKMSLMGNVKEIFLDRPMELTKFMGNEDTISISMKMEDFMKYKKYLEREGLNYNIV